MKQCIFIVTFFSFLSICADDKEKKCLKQDGFDTPLPFPLPYQNLSYYTSTSGNISIDLNEIIESTDYDDNLRCVITYVVLSHTIFFENDPGLATVYAQRVDLHINFADKAAIKDFGLCMASPTFRGTSTMRLPPIRIT